MTNAPLNNPQSAIRNPQLIVALDVDTPGEARRIFDELRETNCVFKIGLRLFTAAGADFVRELVAADARIFLDLKFHDIPNTVADAGIEAARLGVMMFNVHALGGREMMEQTAARVRETCSRENLKTPKIIAVTVLTSSNQAVLHETGVTNKVETQVLNLAKLAAEAGLDGVVASPLETAKLREIYGEDFLIVTPGIRLPQAAIKDDDQKRTLTPLAAVQAGASFIVVGRPILTAHNRLQAVREILAQMSDN